MRPGKRPVEIIVIADSDDESSAISHGHRNKTPRLENTTGTNRAPINIDSEDEKTNNVPFKTRRRNSRGVQKQEDSDSDGPLPQQNSVPVPGEYNGRAFDNFPFDDNQIGTGHLGADQLGPGGLGAGEFDADQFGGGYFDDANFDFNQLDNNDWNLGQFNDGQLARGAEDHGGVDNDITFFDNNGFEMLDNNGTFACWPDERPDTGPRTPQPQLSPEEKCLQHTLEMFPDIAHNHVMLLFGETEGDIQAVLERIMETPNYPKERDCKTKEIAREPTVEVEEKRFTAQDREIAKGRKRQAM